MNFQNCHIAAIGEKNRQVCPHQSVAKIACDQIRRDRRIKSPGLSPALANSILFDLPNFRFDLPGERKHSYPYVWQRRVCDVQFELADGNRK